MPLLLSIPFSSLRFEPLKVTPLKIRPSCAVGSGVGTSGRVMAFCLGRRGSNLGTGFGFFQFKIAVNLFPLGVRLFLITHT